MKPPQNRIDTLRRKLMLGESLTIGDRIAAVWFINASEGTPQIDAGELEKYDKAMADYIANDHNQSRANE